MLRLCARESTFCLTRFSMPEYVWMTYHSPYFDSSSARSSLSATARASSGGGVLVRVLRRLVGQQDGFFLGLDVLGEPAEVDLHLVGGRLLGAAEVDLEVEVGIVRICHALLPKICRRNQPNARSSSPTMRIMMSTKTSTAPNMVTSCGQVGHTTFLSSPADCRTNSAGLPAR